MVTEQAVREALRHVMDPEIGMSVADLGMIRQVEIEGEKVAVGMVLTIPNCPLAEYLVEQVRQAVLGVEGVEEAEVNLLPERWDPSWISRG